MNEPELSGVKSHVVSRGDAQLNGTTKVEVRVSATVVLRRDLFCWGNAEEEANFHAHIRERLLASFRCGGYALTDVTYVINYHDPEHVAYTASGTPECEVAAPAFTSPIKQCPSELVISPQYKVYCTLATGHASPHTNGAYVWQV